MQTISDELVNELRQRVAAGEFSSVDELVRAALDALDSGHGTTVAWLEAELLKGLEGVDVELTDAELSAVEREALELIESRRTK